MAWDEFGRENDFWIDFEKRKEDWAYRNKIREQNREIELKESTNKTKEYDNRRKTTITQRPLHEVALWSNCRNNFMGWNDGSII